MPKINSYFDLDQFRTDIVLKRHVAQCISVREAAEEIGINHTVLFRIEAKGTMPEINTALKICDWLGTDISKYIKKK